MIYTLTHIQYSGVNCHDTATGFENVHQKNMKLVDKANVAKW